MVIHEFAKSQAEQQEEQEEQQQEQFSNFKDRGFALAVKNVRTILWDICNNQLSLLVIAGIRFLLAGITFLGNLDLSQ